MLKRFSRFQLIKFWPATARAAPINKRITKWVSNAEPGCQDIPNDPRKKERKQSDFQSVSTFPQCFCAIFGFGVTFASALVKYRSSETLIEMTMVNMPHRRQPNSRAVLTEIGRFKQNLNGNLSNLGWAKLEILEFTKNIKKHILSNHQVMARTLYSRGSFFHHGKLAKCWREPRISCELWYALPINHYHCI